MDSKNLEIEIGKVFGNRIRIRACGWLETAEGILLIKHNGIGTKGYLWAPPGGEPCFGETITEAVEREFLEETGLIVKCNSFAFYNEYIGNGLHALELFYNVDYISGKLIVGTDPELDKDKQIMAEIRFWKRSEIAVYDKAYFHARFSQINL